MNREIVPILVSVKDTKMDEKWKTLAPILGKVRDTLIAECYGVSRERVRQARERLGIPPFNISTGCRSFVEKYNIPIEEIKNLSDDELCKKYSVTRSVVAALRQKYGICRDEKSMFSGTLGAKRKRLLEVWNTEFDRRVELRKKFTLGDVEKVVSKKLNMKITAVRTARYKLKILCKQNIRQSINQGVN